MAEAAFSSDLSSVSAPRGADSFGRVRPVRPQSESGGIAAFAGLASTIFQGALAIEDRNTKRGLSKGVDEAIDLSLAKVTKLKEASGQSGNLTEAFNLNLMAEVKRLKTIFDPDEVNKVLISRGFKPPRSALFDEIAGAEQREEQAAADRIEEAIDTATEQGTAVTDVNGVVDREATFELMQVEARAQGVQRDVMAQLGVVQKPDGTLSETARLKYFQMRPELQAAVWKQAMVGLRVPLNKLNNMLRTATPGDIGEIKKQILDVTLLADRFRLGQVRNSVGLNKPEREDHMAYVDSLLLAVTGGILELKDAKDLNTMKAMAATLDWANTHIDQNNIEDFPTIVAIGRMSQNAAAAVIAVGMGDKKVKAEITRRVSGELERFANRKTPIKDFFAPRPDPKPTDLPELGSDEDQYSAEDKKDRVQKSIDIQGAFQNESVKVEKDTDAFAFIQLHGPTFNARNELTSDDKDVLARMYTAPLYAQSLEAAEGFFPEKTAAVGAYAFDIVQQDLQNNLREMVNLSTLGRLHRDFIIEWDDLSKKFVVVDTEEFKSSALAVEEGLGTPKGGTFAQTDSIKLRLKRINEDVAFMVKTSRFKERFEKLTPAQFMTDMKGIVAGQLAPPKGQEDITPRAANDIAVEMIAKFEAFAPVALAPKKGDLPTKGFGNTRGVKVGDKSTREEAMANLKVLVEEQMIFIDEAVTVPLNDNQMAALASLIYNVGKGAFGRSKALKALNAGDMETFREEVEDEKKGFVRLTKKGPPLAGLIKRRKAEMKLFFKEVQ